MQNFVKRCVLLLSALVLCFTLVACDPVDPAPSVTPSVIPSAQPSAVPSMQPSAVPSMQPSAIPSVQPSATPSVIPSAQPSVIPTVVPTSAPSVTPSVIPSVIPSAKPSVTPSVIPSVMPSVAPSSNPGVKPSMPLPSVIPSVRPSVMPSVAPGAFDWTKAFVVKDGVILGLNELGKTQLPYVQIPPVIDHQKVHAIAPNAFSDVENLQYVVCMEGSFLGRLEDYAFANCKNLRAVVLGQDTIQFGEHVFAGCNSVVVYSPLAEPHAAWGTQWQSETRGAVFGYDAYVAYAYMVYGIKDDIGYVVKQSPALTEPKIYGDVENSTGKSYRVEHIADNAFSYCENLNTIYIPKCIKTIGENAFMNCTKLFNVEMEWEISELTTLKKGAFFGCEKLEIVRLPDSLQVIGERAFSCCYALRKVDIPKGVIEIGDYAFSFCAKLEDFYFNEAKVQTIGEGAFYGCESLRKLVLPESVTTVKAWAFEGCLILNLYCRAQEKPEGFQLYWDVRVSDGEEDDGNGGQESAERHYPEWGYQGDENY